MVNIIKCDKIDLDNKELEITKDEILENFIVCIVILTSIMLAIFKIGPWPGLIYLFIGPLIFLIFYLRDNILRKK